MADCDAIIVNYNAGDLLRQCVDSVLVAGVARVIVVDNDSGDKSVELLELACGSKNVSIIRNGRNLGFAAACNIGARASSSNRLLFLNPDCLMSGKALSAMRHVLEREERAAVVGGRLCNPDGTEQSGGRRSFPSPKRAIAAALGLSRLQRLFPRLFSDFHLHRSPLPSQPVPVDAVSGACMLVKREAIEDVGLWDEGYFLHCEDLDWCMRFRQAGWKIMFVPEAQITHVKGACSRDCFAFVEWHKHRGMLRYYHKFLRSKYPGLLWMLVVMGVWLRFGFITCGHALIKWAAAMRTVRG